MDVHRIVASLVVLLLLVVVSRWIVDYSSSY